MDHSSEVLKQYFLCMLLIMLCKRVLALKSVDETLACVDGE